ncbi:MAG: ABC transporter ATP-binding protein [Acidimicrobiia bacterium]
MSNLIKFSHVFKSFHVKNGAVNVLKDISFTVPKGSFTILFGPSGSGKSTILNTILGLEPPTSGRVDVNDINLYSLSSDQRAKFRTHFVGMVTQDNYWVNSLSVIDNVALPLYLCGYPRTKARKMAKRSVENIQLERYLNSRPTVLSGGEQQRISVARATVKNPEIIIADEPTGNLDTKSGNLVLNLLLNQTGKDKTTVVMVTHNPDFLQYANNVLMIKDGVMEQTNDFGEG